jgi:hypothetical protein
MLIRTQNKKKYKPSRSNNAKIMEISGNTQILGNYYESIQRKLSIKRKSRTYTKELK